MQVVGFPLFCIDLSFTILLSNSFQVESHLHGSMLRQVKEKYSQDSGVGQAWDFLQIKVRIQPLLLKIADFFHYVPLDPLVSQEFLYLLRISGSIANALFVPEKG